jgi:anaerobic selenocysteine-containing dehydrogenase
MTYVPGVVEPPGEAKPHWIYTELARRLGIGEVYNTYCEEGGNWWEGWEKYLRNEFDRMAEELLSQGTQMPEWEEFKKSGNAWETNETPFMPTRRSSIKTPLKTDRKDRLYNTS